MGGVEHLSALKGLKELRVLGTRISDGGVDRLKKALPRAKMTAPPSRITAVLLGRTQIADAHLAHLVPLVNLEKLTLNSTQLTDAGMMHLRRLPKLKELNLADTKISDAGLASLADLKHLEWLSLIGHFAG